MLDLREVLDLDTTVGEMGNFAVSPTTPDLSEFRTQKEDGRPPFGTTLLCNALLLDNV